jgi:copper chaperone CopZ
MSVTKGLQKLPGAADIQVSSSAGTAHLTVDDSVDEAQIKAVVEEAGFKLS